MAVRQTITYDGTNYPDAYHKINTLTYRSYSHPSDTGDIESRSELHYEVEVYRSQAERNSNLDPVYRLLFNLDAQVGDTDPDIIEQAYTHLKSLPDYVGATDV